MLIAVAAMASVSCQKEEAQAPVEPKSTTITLKADVVDTKTYITEDNAVLWGTGEYVQLYFNNGTDDPQFVKSNSDNADVWDESDEAMFSFDITYNPADSYTLGGVYPASVVADSNTDAKNYKVILPSTQNASSTSYDPAAFIMIMKPETIADADFDKDGHIAYFRRAVALNKITLTGVKEAINSVAITAEGKDLAGRRKFNLTTGAEGEIYYGQTSTITVNATYPAGDIDVWFTSWGAELVEGETLKVVLKSETKTYEKTIAARAEGIKFVEGSLNKLAIDMSSIEGATSAVALPFVEDFAAITSGSNTASSGSGTAVTSAMMSQFSSYASATYQAGGAVRIGKSGNLTTKELDLSKDFHVIVSAKGWSASELLLTVTAGSQVNDIELTTYMAGDFVDYIINFDAIDNSEVVKFTTTSNKRCFIDKIQILEGYAELPSVLTAENPEIMAAAGGAGSFAYTLTNPKEGQKLTATTDAEWITDITVNEGTVSYTVDENTVEESREATITLKYEGVDDVTVTVAQAGYVDPNQIHKVTVDAFKALTGTETATFELTGVVSEIYQAYDSSYDNISFYIEDETGKVLIFRMDCTDDASLASLKVGDKVTVQGKPTLYDSVIQMAAGGVCTSYMIACNAPVISCEDNTVTIEAETGATIHYTTDGTDPTESSDVYSVPFEITETKTVKAIAVADGKFQSVIASKVCMYVDPNADSKVPSSTACYTLTTSTAGSNNSYAGNCDITVDGITWNLTGNSTTDPWRMGGKSLNGVDRVIYSKTAYPSALSKVEFVSGTMNVTSWNSLKLEYSTNADFTDAQTIDASEIGASKTITFAPEGGFPANCYFRFVLNITVTGSSNKYIQLKNIIFYGYEN